jgi:hypothetical protein
MIIVILYGNIIEPRKEHGHESTQENETTSMHADNILQQISNLFTI